jgi:site-specific DNA-methyltransferase (adenine-specific)
MIRLQLHLGNCLDILRTMPECSVDSIVTDPPYGLAFMGKRWDYDVPSTEIWAECLRVLKPGGHLLAFAGTRSQHRMAVRIEDAGFEIRDMIAWVYGSGFPKSLDVSKAIDKAAGNQRGTTPDIRNGPNTKPTKGDKYSGGYEGQSNTDAGPVSEDAARWQGWGTALKPALEPITVARKPLAGTVAANVLAHGAGALNIDGCRVPGESTMRTTGKVLSSKGAAGGAWSAQSHELSARDEVMATGSELGRWPANLIHDGSDEVVALFPTEKRQSAARFFYAPKASKRDRGEGNTHPTVKPTDLMAYLCRLVTPPGGIVLDPFMGSGSTGKAAMREGFRFIGCELDAGYFEIAKARIKAAQPAADNDNGEPLEQTA